MGDHWEQKERPGPSDPLAKQPTREARRVKGETFGGVDVEGNSRRELLDRAKQLGVRGAAGMTKPELGRAVRKKQKAA